MRRRATKDSTFTRRPDPLVFELGGELIALGHHTEQLPQCEAQLFGELVPLSLSREPLQHFVVAFGLELANQLGPVVVGV